MIQCHHAFLPGYENTVNMHQRNGSKGDQSSMYSQILKSPGTNRKKNYVQKIVHLGDITFIKGDEGEIKISLGEVVKHTIENARKGLDY